jgi:hypothetical protein
MADESQSNHPSDSWPLERMRCPRGRSRLKIFWQNTKQVGQVSKKEINGEQHRDWFHFIYAVAVAIYI